MAAPGVSYLVDSLAVALQSWMAVIVQITPSMDCAARSLGSAGGTLLPSTCPLWRSALAAGLQVFET